MLDLLQQKRLRKSGFWAAGNSLTNPRSEKLSRASGKMINIHWLYIYIHEQSSRLMNMDVLLHHPLTREKFNFLCSFDSVTRWHTASERRKFRHPPGTNSHIFCSSLLPHFMANDVKNKDDFFIHRVDFPTVHPRPSSVYPAPFAFRCLINPRRK